VTGSWLNDDDEFMTELGEAMRAPRDVPDSFVRAGKSAFAWHNVDSELARLVSDSAILDPAQRSAAGLRSERAALRSLTFASDELTIELDVHPDALRGQVAPAQSGTLQLRSNDESVRDFPIDEVGWFVISPLPQGPFRLSIRLDGGPAALTDWVTL
jgi:hypothetical protein